MTLERVRARARARAGYTPLRRAIRDTLVRARARAQTMEREFNSCRAGVCARANIVTRALEGRVADLETSSGKKNRSVDSRDSRHANRLGTSSHDHRTFRCVALRDDVTRKVTTFLSDMIGFSRFANQSHAATKMI